MRFVGSHNWSLDGSLEEVEMVFKSLYEKNPDLQIENPHELDDCAAIHMEAARLSATPLPQTLLQERLEEKTFFAEENDIELYFHLRYLPCMWHSHDFFEIICVIQGACTHYIADRKMQLEEGDICIVAPNTRHALSAFSDKSVVLNILLRTSTFETAFFDTLADDNILSHFFHHTLYHSKAYPYLLFRIQEDQKLYHYIGCAFEEARSNNTYKKRMMNTIITSFFIMLLRNHSANVVVPELVSLDQHQSVFYILRYMREHYTTTSLPELAAVFNYSERQIQRIVTSATGMSFTANILKLKMSRAERLLLHSDLSVTDIAAALGYTNVRIFRQTFKRYYGQTPTDYRNEQTTREK